MERSCFTKQDRKSLANCAGMRSAQVASPSAEYQTWVLVKAKMVSPHSCTELTGWIICSSISRRRGIII